MRSVLLTDMEVIFTNPIHNSLYETPREIQVKNRKTDSEKESDFSKLLAVIKSSTYHG